MDQLMIDLDTAIGAYDEAFSSQPFTTTSASPEALSKITTQLNRAVARGSPLTDEEVSEVNERLGLGFEPDEFII